MNNRPYDVVDLTKQRWIVLFASCLINLCCGSIYAWSVFARPMAETIGVESLAIVFTVANAVGPITMIPGGSINDKLGPKWVIFVGGIIFGGGMIASGFAASMFHLVLTYGLGCGLGMGLIYGCTIGNSVKFFPDKRGLIGGIATASYGISSVIVPPVANALISAVGVRAAFKVLGCVFLFVICGAAFFVRACPPSFVPQGWKPKKNSDAIVSQTEKNWKQMLADPIFYVMLLILTCGGVFGLMTISCASSIAQNMILMTPSAAAVCVSVIALFNTAGRIIAGSLSDKIGRINTLSIAMVLALFGLGALYLSEPDTVVLFIVGLVLIGVCFGTFMGVFPGFTADQFGAKNNTVNYGIMWIGFAIAGVVGPTILTSIYQSVGAYQPAFLVAGAIAVIGLILSVLYRGMSR